VELMEDNYMGYLLGEQGYETDATDVAEWNDVEDGDWVLD